MTFQYEMGACTEQGARKNNQDAVITASEVPFAAVADGMGGAAGGQEASRIAVETAREILSETGEATGEVLQRLVSEANSRVRARAEADDHLRGMGTTLVLLLFRGGSYHLANVGDSRAYRIRAGELRQLSRDHSLVQARYEAGLIREEEITSQPDRNVITRAVGVDDRVEAELHSGTVQAGDRFLLSSDGVHGVLGRDRLQALVQEGGDCTTVASRLVQAALAAGSTDNASAVVVRVREPAGGNQDDELDAILKSAPLAGRALDGTRHGALPWVMLLLAAAAGAGGLWAWLGSG